MSYPERGPSSETEAGPDPTQGGPSPDRGGMDGGPGLAIAALVLGCCSFIPLVGLATAMAAVLLGLIVLLTPRPGNGLAGAGIVAGLVLCSITHAVVMPNLLISSHEPAWRAHCAANLNGIGKGLGMWTNDPTRADSGYPRLGDGPDNDPATMLPGGADDVQDLYQKGKYENFLENLNLLVEDGLIGHMTFICRSGGSEVADRTGRNKAYGFNMYTDPWKGPETYYAIDYAYHLGYDNGRNPATWEKAGGDFVILADANIGDAKTVDESWRHGADGVNVLTASGGVKWINADDNGCIVVNGDNIYTNGGRADTSGKTDAEPTTASDQVLYSPK